MKAPFYDPSNSRLSFYVARRDKMWSEDVTSRGKKLLYLKNDFVVIAKGQIASMTVIRAQMLGPDVWVSAASEEGQHVLYLAAASCLTPQPNSFTY